MLKYLRIFNQGQGEVLDSSSLVPDKDLHKYLSCSQLACEILESKFRMFFFISTQTSFFDAIQSS